MGAILVIGAGITGGYAATRLFDNGADISLLARGEKADRLEQFGLRLRDGLTGVERTVRLPIVREPVEKQYEIVMVCVQDTHRPAVEQLIQDLPGRPVVWFLGNTTRGYENPGALLGRDRIVGGFPDVGGTWDEHVLVYADRSSQEDNVRIESTHHSFYSNYGLAFMPRSIDSSSGRSYIYARRKS